MLAFVTIAPTDKGSESLSEYVAEILDIIDRSGLAYRTGPMGTTIEGEWDAVMAVVKECHFKMREHSGRVGTLIKIDDRVDATGRLDGKTASIEKRLGRDLRK